jgi:hypothetical protein
LTTSAWTTISSSSSNKSVVPAGLRAPRLTEPGRARQLDAGDVAGAGELGDVAGDVEPEGVGE